MVKVVFVPDNGDGTFKVVNLEGRTEASGFHTLESAVYCAKKIDEQRLSGTQSMADCL